MLLQVYGKAAALSKMQLRIWARFAQFERDLVLFAFPMSVLFVYFAAKIGLKARFPIEIHASIVFIGFGLLILYFILGTIQTAYRLSFKTPPWNHLTATIVNSFKAQVLVKAILEKFIKSPGDRYIFSTFKLDIYLIWISFLFIIFKLCLNFLPLQPDLISIIIVWIGFEFILAGWKQRESIKWLDLIIFSDIGPVLLKVMSMALIVGTLTGLLHALLFGSITASLVVGAAPIDRKSVV